MDRFFRVDYVDLMEFQRLNPWLCGFYPNCRHFLADFPTNSVFVGGVGHDLHSWWIFHIYLSLLEGILHVRLLKKLNVIWFKDHNQIARILNDETDVYCVYMICICIIYILYHIAGHIP
jgi:hypothetical protein